MKDEAFEQKNIFGTGQENNAFAQFFIGKSYLNPLTSPEECGLLFANVTFEPGCRNNWHIHHAKKGGGQILLCIAGEGWYQEWGKDAHSLAHHPSRGEALARCEKGLLVFSYRGRSAGRGPQQRVAGGSHGRNIYAAALKPAYAGGVFCAVISKAGLQNIFRRDIILLHGMQSMIHGAENGISGIKIFSDGCA